MHPLLEKEATRLLLGNEAVVRGALEAGIGAFSTYPGTPASEIGDTFAALHSEVGCFFECAVNEKVALETIIAFSLSGWRSMAAMKHVGLNVAADALMTFPYLGVVGGAVIVSADDPGCHSSQNEQDNRHLARMAGTPMFEPSNPAEARDLTRAAFEWSERLGLPVLVRLTTRVAHMRGPVVLRTLPSRPVAGRTFQRDPLNRVVVPAVARRRHEELARRLKDAARAADLPEFRSVVPSDSGLGIIATGAARGLVRDALDRLGLCGRVSLLEFSWTWPHPTEAIVSFLRSCRRVLVVEEGTPFQEDAIAAIAHRVGIETEILGKATDHLRELGELTPDSVTFAVRDLVVTPRGRGFSTPEPPSQDTTPAFPLPARPPVLCPGCPHRASYLLARQVVGGDALVATDIGCYTLGFQPPLGMGDLLVCMGSSVSTAAALAVAQDRPVLAVIGDSTFFHAGIPALVNAVTYRRRFMLLVLDNRTTAMTGFQPTPGAFLDHTGTRRSQSGRVPDERVSIEAIARACGVAVVETVDPYHPAEALDSLRRAWNSQGVSVVVARSPCPQMAERARLLPRRPPVRIVRERCRTCGNTGAGRHCGMPHSLPYQEVRARMRLLLAPSSARSAPPIGSYRPLDHPPCTAACPAQICVQGYVGLVAAGRFEDAYELVRRRIPFPAVCAYVCPHPCEAACVHERPVAIRHLKRMAVMFGFRPGLVRAGPDTGQRVAIVGAGPSGLTAAECLRRAGHAVTIYEASATPGGLLTHAIPRFRLPEDVVQREVSEVLALGVDLVTGFALGRNGSVDDLIALGHKAVVLAIGLSRSVGLSVPGSDLPGIEDALRFLRDAAWGRTREVEGDVVVIGGGNTAMDAARVALRLGARSATVVYRRSREEMPAFSEEVDLARREGVRFVFQANPVRFEGDGRVRRSVFVRTSLGPKDASGRPRPIPIPDSDFALPSDRVFLALGQSPCDPAELGLRDIETTPGGWPVVDPHTLMTSRPGVFVCGDAAGGPATVIHAIHSGQAVASSVDHYLLTGQPRVSDAYRSPSVETGIPPWREAASRVGDIPWSPDPAEWEGRRDLHGIAKEHWMRLAMQEAARCVQCGTCANCRACVELTGCPALRWREASAANPEGPEVIESLCNGCGLCMLVCPNGAIIRDDE